jgi:hypothetical protein
LFSELVSSISASKLQLNWIFPASAEEILLRHVHVNAIADYYDIPPLKELANTKIKHLLETSWSADGFSHVVKEVFNATRDTALHNMVTSAAAAHIEELLELDDFTALEVMSDFAIGIIRTTIAARKANEESSRQKLQAAESRLRNAESINTLATTIPLSHSISVRF